MHKFPLYEQGDPCLDGYFSVGRQHLIFWARRKGPSGVMILDAMMCSFSSLPLNEVLGHALLGQLNLIKKILSSNDDVYLDIQSGCYDPMRFSASCVEFSAEYNSFSLWTKDDGGVPYFVGVPVSNEFPFGGNSRTINKPLSDEEFGFEFKKFLTEFFV